MQTKIIKSIGSNSNPRNLTTIGYCVESPQEVLKYVLEEGYRIGGYRQAGETRPFGDGLVIRGADMEPIDFGLDVTCKLEQIPFSEYDLKLDKVTEENLQWMFGNRGGNLQVYRDEEYQNLFRVKQELLRPEDDIIMATAKEFVETVKGQPVTLDYLISLSK